MLLGHTMPRASLFLLHRGGRDARRPDAVRTHDDRPFVPRLVQHRGTQRFRVLGAELEDVADLNHLLHDERRAAFRAGRRLLAPRAGRRTQG